MTRTGSPLPSGSDTLLSSGERGTSPAPEKRPCRRKGALPASKPLPASSVGSPGPEDATTLPSALVRPVAGQESYVASLKQTICNTPAPELCCQAEQSHLSNPNRAGSFAVPSELALRLRPLPCQVTTGDGSCVPPTPWGHRHLFISVSPVSHTVTVEFT